MLFRSNNAAHVEAIFLYLGNKLVEEGKTIAFPYYYGCVNAIDPHFHALINDEYDDNRYKFGEDTADALYLFKMISPNEKTLTKLKVKNFRNSKDSEGWIGTADDLINFMLEYGIIKK